MCSNELSELRFTVYPRGYALYRIEHGYEGAIIVLWSSLAGALPYALAHEAGADGLLSLSAPHCSEGGKQTHRGKGRWLRHWRNRHAKRRKFGITADSVG